MGGFKTVWKIEYLPLYPDAKEKIAYYQEIITKLDSLHTRAYYNLLYDITDKNPNEILLDKTIYSESVLNATAEGEYYNEYKDYKEVWFTNYKNMLNKLDQCVKEISDRKKKAEILRDEWVEKSKKTYPHSYTVNEPIDADTQED